MTVTEADAHDVRLVRRTDGLLGVFNRAGVLGPADVHVATRLRRLGGETDERVLLAAALTVRAVRQGSVCLVVADAAGTTAVDGVPADEVAGLPWPEAASWPAALEASPIVATGPDHAGDRPLRLVDGLLYLDRYWRQEQVIARYVDAAMLRRPPAPDPDRLASALARLLPGTDPDRQRLAAVVAAHRRFSILAGGPGTGKTTTVAKLLALLQDLAEGRLRIALAAPTGKAAARLTEAVADASAELPAADRARLAGLQASTLHRLLGSRPGARTRFWHDRDNRLPHDVVVVDEASMVSLTMMSRLVEALRPDTRLVLVGDPDQLASVEVGAVLGDLVERPSSTAAAPMSPVAGGDLADLTADEREAAVGRGVVRLSHVYRFDAAIQRLADGIRTGTPEAVLAAIADGGDSVELLDVDPAQAAELGDLREDVVSSGRAMHEAACSGDAAGALAALDAHRLLCAHREGRHGVRWWGERVEEWLAAEIEGYAGEQWYVGRPLLVTSNDYRLRLFNGDTGVVVDVEGRRAAAFRREGELALIGPSRLSDVHTVHALSIHRSQGSQFDTVTVILPPSESPLLTRELLYTAVTRAKRKVRIVGTSDALAAAVGRPITRASGLGSHHVGAGSWGEG